MLVLVVSGSRTDGSRLDHVADGEALDGLVLGDAAGAVGAAHRLGVAAAVLVAAAKKSISTKSIDHCNVQPSPPSSCPAMRLNTFVQYIRSGVFCSRSSASLRRSCRLGDFAADIGGNRPYLFALFLTILTDCSVESQTFERMVVE